MKRAVQNFVKQNRTPGLVSHEIPLISNLNIVENVALIKQYHQNASRTEAHNIVFQYLKQLNLEHIARARNPHLSEEERFCGMLLRAAMVQSGVLLIYKPFMLLPANKNAIFIYNILKNIDDLYTQCFIFDFSWNKYLYGINHVKKF
ncbi:MAG: hypothetical protein KJN62_06405 [Deltaproteobacteria bacterium]|nr:hypothetical protein [Deltaproteobacteria bacterium]